jgi:hypothetical protein
MAGKTRPSLRTKTLQNVDHSNLSITDKECIHQVFERYEKLTTADVVEVKHGHFVRNVRNIPKMKEFHEKGFALSMNTKSIFWTCSCCGSWASLTQKYCSECGAKMDGGKKE